MSGAYSSVVFQHFVVLELKSLERVFHFSSIFAINMFGISGIVLPKYEDRLTEI